MYPQIEVFGWVIGSYLLMMSAGFLVFGVYAGVTAGKRKYDFIDMGMFFSILLIGLIIGCHLLYALVNYRHTLTVLGNLQEMNVIKAFVRIFNGRIFYGGLIGTLAVCYIVIRKDNDCIKYLDIIAVGIPLFHFFARIGCFLAGCCYGVPSKIGFIYNNSRLTAANDIMRFPVQLLESLFCLALFFCLHFLFINNKFKNNLLYLYLLIYPTGRFLIEFLRGDTSRGIWFIFSTSQIISILLVLFVLIKFFTINKKHNNIKETIINMYTGSRAEY